MRGTRRQPSRHSMGGIPPFVLLVSRIFALMALNVRGITIKNQTSNADPAALFKALSDEFGIDNKITENMVTVLQFQDLDDFGHLFAKPEDVPVFVQKMPIDEKDKSLQVSRLRRAWAAVQSTIEQAAQRANDVVKNEDDDAVLPIKDIAVAMKVFWQRYKICFPVDTTPADLTLSRAIKEIDNKSLVARSVWKAPSLTSQLSSQVKEVRVSEQVVMRVGKEMDGGVAKTVLAYLRKLKTLLNAYAVAGAKAKADVNQQPEHQQSDPTEYVEAPLCQLLKYYDMVEYRAFEVLQRNPQQALKWLTARDEEERRIWMDRMRETGLSLGKIIKASFGQRDAVWASYPSASAVPHSPPPSGRARSPRVNPKAKRPRLQPSALLRTGVEIGEGRLEPCPQSLTHLCSGALKKDRACGMANHRAFQCKNKHRT